MVVCTTPAHVFNKRSWSGTMHMNLHNRVHCSIPRSASAQPPSLALFYAMQEQTCGWSTAQGLQGCCSGVGPVCPAGGVGMRQPGAMEQRLCSDRAGSDSESQSLWQRHPWGGR
jgi:hypothetical protein